MNDENLIPNSGRSPEELREMGGKGGIKSGESRRRKRDQKKTAELMAKILLESEEAKAIFEDLKKMFCTDISDT